MHKHVITGYSENPQMAIMPSDWLTCKEHNPHMNMSPKFLFDMIRKHPDWFEVKK